MPPAKLPSVAPAEDRDNLIIAIAGIEADKLSTPFYNPLDPAQPDEITCPNCPEPAVWSKTPLGDGYYCEECGTLDRR